MVAIRHSEVDHGETAAHIVFRWNQDMRHTLAMIRGIPVGTNGMPAAGFRPKSVFGGRARGDWLALNGCGFKA